jgi:hypothetical protein
MYNTHSSHDPFYNFIIAFTMYFCLIFIPAAQPFLGTKSVFYTQVMKVLSVINLLVYYVFNYGNL